MRPHRILAPLALLPWLAPLSSAQDYVLSIAPRASSVNLDATFEVELPSSLIGDWDPDTNPGGTRTLPGLFGGSGNQPIPMDLAFAGTTGFARVPLGGLELSVDLGASTLELRALQLDLLGGAPALSTLSLTFFYSTFRSFQPDSLYIGGIPLTLPLGEQSITQAGLVQTAAAVGALFPSGPPDTYAFLVLMPAELTLVIEASGQSIPIGPLPVVLPLSGELALSGGNAQLSFDLALALDQTIPDPLPGFAIEDAPIELPTILPPGNTAYLLLDATIAALTLVTDLAAGIVAEGPAVCGFESYCEAQPNSTGAMALLETVGSPDAIDGELTITATGLPLHTSAFFVLSSEPGFLPSFRGHVGTLCLSPRYMRFAQNVLDSGSDGAVRFTPDFDALPSGVSFLPGSTWHFQLWYRDLDPLPTWNSSDGARVRFCAD